MTSCGTDDGFIIKQKWVVRIWIVMGYLVPGWWALLFILRIECGVPLLS